MKKNEFKTRGRVLNKAAYIYDFFNYKTDIKIYKKIIKMVNIKPDYKILDIGCGTGTITLKISESLDKKQAGKIIGIDASADMIKKSLSKVHSNNQTIKFQQGLAEKLNFENNNFDIVINTMLLHHLPVDLKFKSLLEMKQVLKPDGILVCTDIDTPLNIFAKIFGIISYTVLIQNEIKQNMQIGISNMLKKSGFKNIKKHFTEYGFIGYYTCTK